ncbi:hypothetical protein [Paraburkholderia sp. BCC1886]|uniref:hypothetical protein n=1 Tax=Paraburkholderia sp. BCC1886 TaxID=2562670 RepID=UPI0011837A19|nr:hypothetical protein [Paraburkholderia sp. BCC1886]
MLRKLLIGARLSRGVVRAAAGLAILLYLTVYWKAGSFLPEFISRDAEKIQSQIGGSSTYQDTSFDAVAKFYASLGEIGTHLFVMAVGAAFIGLTLGCSRRAGGLLLNAMLVAPCVFFNLFVASKDTLVVLISILLVLIGRRGKTGPTVVAAIALYGAYAFTVRSYFALILVIAALTWMFRLGSLRVRTVLIVALLLGLYVLPNGAYYLLLHPRDMAVDYLVAGSPYGARTGFYNPFEPVSFTAFCLDYGYALLKLNMPALFFPGPKELAMSVFVWIVIGSVFGRNPAGPGSAQASITDGLASLVIGHIAVSMLFEPDLGSYLRHLSSVVLFCAWRLNGSATRRT